jgi:hypothetical protein
MAPAGFHTCVCGLDEVALVFTTGKVNLILSATYRQTIAGNFANRQSTEIKVREPATAELTASNRRARSAKRAPP